MWIVSVMQIGRAAAHKEFSYFSARPHQEGAIANIPARGKESWGLVMRSVPLTEIRQHVKGADFKLQKITGESRRIMSREFLRAVFDIAQVSACSAGAVLSDLMPQAVLERYADFPEVFQKRSEKNERQRSPSHLVLPRIERRKKYDTIARACLTKKKKSLLLIAPTVVEAGRLAQALSDIGPVYLLHGSLSKKKMRETWKDIGEPQAPLIVVGTPMALSCPLRDIGTIIVERAGARGYVRDERPFLNIIAGAEMLAQEFGAELYLGSPAPLVAEKKADMPASALKSEVVDMRPPKSDIPRKQAFELFSPNALGLIAAALEKKESILLWCARKGLATSTVCDDCGATFSCARCNSTLVLYTSPRGREFRCSLCGTKESAVAKCRTCGGWRLTPLGIGTERVLLELEKLFPEAEIFRADEDTLGVFKKASALAAQFSAASGALLIATEGMLPYIEHTAHTIVVSLDSLLFIPEYAAGEQALQTLGELRGLTKGRFLLQTRAPQMPLMRALTEGDIPSFVEEELRLRKQFSYPPFSTLIRLTLAGQAAQVAKEGEKLKELLAAYHPENLGVRPAARRGKSKRTGAAVQEQLLLRLAQKRWPEPTLLALLRRLPPSVEIRVNPRALFSD